MRYPRPIKERIKQAWRETLVAYCVVSTIALTAWWVLALLCKLAGVEQ